MKVTKLDHSGLILEKNEHKIVFDPVNYGFTIPHLTNVDAIVITHGHGDHFQLENVVEITTSNPEAKIFTCPEMADQIPHAIAVSAGEVITLDNFTLEFFGEQHAEIFPGKPVCQNIGCLVDGSFANPGDSLELPPSKPRLLCVAAAAPWLKTCEAVDYINRVSPEFALPIHDAILTPLGQGFARNIIKNSSATEIVLEPGESYEF